MKELFQQTLLYDFYGELLTPHQQEIYRQFVLEDFSLSEIAQQAGTSRQAVHDLVRRSEKTLQDYEQRLHLVERFLFIREQIRQIETLTELLQTKDEKKQEEVAAKIRKLTREILEEL